jgi:hypothetical protein
MATQNPPKKLAKVVKAETRKALKSKGVKVAVKKALDGGTRKTVVEKIIATAAKKEAGKIVKVAYQKSSRKKAAANA